MEEVTSSKKEIWTMGAYAFITIGTSIGYMYLNTFSTEVLLIPAATLASALLVAKIIDFIVSLFCGVIVEKVTIGKKGKNQNWFYLIRWVMAIAIMLELTDTSAAPLVVRVTIVAACYTLINSMLNIVQTTYYGLVAAVAGPNSANQNAMTVSMMRIASVLAIVSATVPALVTYLPFGNWNYFVMAFIFMVPVPIAMTLMANLAEGKDVPAVKGGSDAGGVTVKAMIGTLVGNPQIMVLFCTWIIYYCADAIFNANFTYYFIYVVGNYAMLSVANMVIMIVGMIGAMVMPKYTAQMGKKRTIILAFAMIGIPMVILGLFGEKSMWIYIVCRAICQVGANVWMPVSVLMYLDCGEWYLWKTGQDTRTVAAGLASPPMKIGNAVGGTIGLYLLSATGYVAGFTPDSVWITKYMNVTCLLPGIIILFTIVVILIGYRISDEDATRYAQENAKNYMPSNCLK